MTTPRRCFICRRPATHGAMCKSCDVAVIRYAKMSDSKLDKAKADVDVKQLRILFARMCKGKAT